MPIRLDDVRHVARLARLELDDATAETFRHQLQAILDYVAVLDTLDVGRIAPTARALEAGQADRADEPRPCLPTREALANAPDPAAGYFRVPRVIKE